MLRDADVGQEEIKELVGRAESAGVEPDDVDRALAGRHARRGHGERDGGNAIDVARERRDAAGAAIGRVGASYNRHLARGVASRRAAQRTGGGAMQTELESKY